MGMPDRNDYEFVGNVRFLPSHCVAGLTRARVCALHACGVRAACVRARAPARRWCFFTSALTPGSPVPWAREEGEMEELSTLSGAALAMARLEAKREGDDGRPRGAQNVEKYAQGGSPALACMQ